MDTDTQTELLTSKLLVEAMRGDLERVQRMLDQGAKVNRPNGRGMTALRGAAMQGNEAVVALLREAGAEDDIFSAALLGDGRLMRALLARGADAHATDEEGDTPLIWAAYKGHAHIVSLLLEIGVGVDTANKRGHTALTLAATQGHPVTVGLLRQAGAPVGFVDAAMLGEVEAVRVALDGGQNVGESGLSGDTALVAAASCNRTECLHLLLAYGADLDAAGARGRTALMAAAEGGHIEAIHLLFDPAVRCGRGASFARSVRSDRPARKVRRDRYPTQTGRSAWFMAMRHNPLGEKAKWQY